MPPTSPTEVQPRASLVEQVHEELNRRIADAVLAPGERLVIDRLAAELGTSLIPVREALARLRAERLVLFEPNRGYRVAPAPTAKEVEKMFAMRVLLEQGALAIGAARLSKRVIAELTAINAGIAAGSYGRSFDGYRTFIERNKAFHETIVLLADNPYLTESYRQLGYHEQTFRLNFGRGVPDLRLIVEEHGAIISALSNDDCRTAGEALADHIRNGYARLVRTGRC